jgi:hypothetical protein
MRTFVKFFSLLTKLKEKVFLLRVGSLDKIIICASSPVCCVGVGDKFAGFGDNSTAKNSDETTTQ